MKKTKDLIWVSQNWCKKLMKKNQGRLGFDPETPPLHACAVNQMGYDGSMVKRSYARDEPYPGTDLAYHGLGPFKKI